MVNYLIMPLQTTKEKQVEPQISSERISDTKAPFTLCFSTLSCRRGMSAVLSSWIRHCLGAKAVRTMLCYCQWCAPQHPGSVCLCRMWHSGSTWACFLCVHMCVLCICHHYISAHCCPEGGENQEPQLHSMKRPHTDLFCTDFKGKSASTDLKMVKMCKDVCPHTL